MIDLTLIIPAKNESESLPDVLNQLKNYNYKVNIILHSSDTSTIEAIKSHNIEIIYQKNLGWLPVLILKKKILKIFQKKTFCLQKIGRNY